MNVSVKKFIAATTRDALRMVREELGDEAVIMSNRKVAEGVEIMAMTTAALSGMTQSHAQSDASRTGLSQPALLPTGFSQHGLSDIPQLNVKAEIGSKAAQLQQLISTPRQPRRIIKQDVVPTAQLASSKAVAPVQPVATGKAAAASFIAPEQQSLEKEIKSMRSMLQEQFACMAWSDMQQRDPKRTSLLRNLVNAGFSPSLARQLLEKMPADADMSWVSQILTHNLHVATQAEDVVARGGVYALTGPTGVGKTTTTAKLAARAVVTVPTAWH
jgi:flagellar biosynthesis protein FlhF